MSFLQTIKDQLTTDPVGDLAALDVHAMQTAPAAEIERLIAEADKLLTNYSTERAKLAEARAKEAPDSHPHMRDMRDEAFGRRWNPVCVKFRCESWRLSDIIALRRDSLRDIVDARTRAEQARPLPAPLRAAQAATTTAHERLALAEKGLQVANAALVEAEHAARLAPSETASIPTAKRMRGLRDSVDEAVEVVSLARHALAGAERREREAHDAVALAAEDVMRGKLPSIIKRIDEKWAALAALGAELEKTLDEARAAGVRGLPFIIPPNASQAALEAWRRCLRQELVPVGPDAA